MRFDDSPYRVLKASGKLFRGPQPEMIDLQELKKRGLKAVINLRAEAEDSKFYCKEIELIYKHIPVDDWRTPTEMQVQVFLEFLAESAHCPALVHCLGGVGRTGLFVSCHRIAMGMSPRDAMAVSDQETPWQGMNKMQREWILEFAEKRAQK